MAFALPLETTSVTVAALVDLRALRRATREITWPLATESEFSSRWSPTLKPALSSRPCAALQRQAGRPAGTPTCAGPSETVSVTVEPFLALLVAGRVLADDLALGLVGRAGDGVGGEALLAQLGLGAGLVGADDVRAR